MTSDYAAPLSAHVADIISVLMVLVILSGRREARSTLVWLLLVVFLPYAGAALYLLFGRLRPEYAPRKIHPALVGASREKPSGPQDRMMELTERITGISSVHCAELELLEGAKAKYERLFADISAATERISISYYVFRDDITGRELLELLARKAEGGVKVRLLCDGWGAFGLFASGALRPYVSRGIMAAPFARVANPFRMSRINFRNHRKIVVIDGRIGYTGSTNIGDEYLGRNRRFSPWRDLHARLTGEAAGILEEVFAEDWRIATKEAMGLPAPSGGGQIPLHIIPTGPDMEEDRLFPLLFAQLAAAETSIDIATPYLVPNQALIAVLSMAARKGVKVRIVLPRRSNHPMVAAAGRSYYEELLVGGVEIFEMSDAMLHAKTVLLDGKWAMIGSANFDNRSFFLNFEINIALSEPRFVGEISRCMAGWRELSSKATLEELKRRPFLLKLVDSVCRTLSPVL